MVQQLQGSMVNTELETVARKVWMNVSHECHASSSFLVAQ